MSLALLLALPFLAPDDAPPLPPILRASVEKGFTLVMRGNDSDGDGRLSRSEWRAMIDISFPDQPAAKVEGVAQIRAREIARHAEMDGDGDGFLTAAELIREPLANFDCLDRDRDGRLAGAEFWPDADRCPSGRPLAIGFVGAETAAGKSRD